MRAGRVALLSAILASSALAQQNIDYSIWVHGGGTAYPGAPVVMAMVAEATYGLAEDQPFVARLTVPAGLTVSSACGSGNSDGEGSFDEATRVFTWPARFNDSSPVGQKNCPLTISVDPSVAPGTSLPFSATITTPFEEQNLSNNTAAYAVVVVAATDLVAFASADIQRVRTGSTVAFTVGATNSGVMDATNTVLRNHLSPHATFLAFEQISGPAAALDAAPHAGLLDANIPLLPPGATATFRVVMRADKIADIYQSTWVQAPIYDPDWSNNMAYMGAFAGPDADLGLRSSRVQAGAAAQVPITITVSNQGPDPVDDVRVDQVLYDTGTWDRAEGVKYGSITPSQGSCTAPEVLSPSLCPPTPGYWTFDCKLGTLAPGGRATISIVIERGEYSGPLSHIATVSPSQNDPNQANNQIEVDLTRPAGKGRAVGIR